MQDFAKNLRKLFVVVGEMGNDGVESHSPEEEQTAPYLR